MPHANQQWGDGSGVDFCGVATQPTAGKTGNATTAVARNTKQLGGRMPRAPSFGVFAPGSFLLRGPNQPLHLID